jgi:hypothetical protein
LLQLSLASKRLRLIAWKFFLRMERLAIRMQVFLVETDSALMGRRVPARNDVTVATLASSRAAVAMVSTAAPGATRAGTAESLATVVTQRRVARILRIVVVVQVDARDGSV